MSNEHAASLAAVKGTGRSCALAISAKLPYTIARPRVARSPYLCFGEPEISSEIAGPCIGRLIDLSIGSSRLSVRSKPSLANWPGQIPPVAEPVLLALRTSIFTIRSSRSHHTQPAPVDSAKLSIILLWHSKDKTVPGS